MSSGLWRWCILGLIALAAALVTVFVVDRLGWLDFEIAVRPVLVWTGTCLLIAAVAMGAFLFAQTDAYTDFSRTWGDSVAYGLFATAASAFERHPGFFSLGIAFLGIGVFAALDRN